ncbi:MAG: DUF4906 domain-containing protein [Alistipes sp.]|nr:DUF4906 domain-containing protein [Alistipes sp.]
MKNLYRYAVIVAMTFLGMSCVNNDYELDTLYPNTEGNSKLKVHFSVKDSELVTRAAQDVSYEYNVQSIYVFVFSGDNRVTLSGSNDEDSNGNINYFDLEEIEEEHNKATINDATSTGVLNLGAVAGANMRICLIANIGVSNSETRAEMTEAISKDVEVFDGITTYTELKQLVLKLGVNSVQRQSAFLLTGEATGVTLDPNPDAVTEVTVPLYRTDAKITFNVKAENTDLKDFKFVPKTWRVMNVPATTYAIPNSEVSADTSIGVGKYLDASNVKSENGDVNYFDSPEVSFEGKVNDADNSGTFTFYMYENLKGPKKSIGSAGYALREKQVKQTHSEDDVVVPGQIYINGEYEYAPELGTYVVFTGQLSYSHEATTENGDKYDEYVMSDAEYCVHLGHNSDTNFDDYKTLRNHHYTYNVTVTGVNDLLVEVEGVSGDGTDKEEKRPGVEGEVVMSSAQLIEVDGHYDRALITFTPEEAKNIFFAVNTPWERGLDTNGFLNSEVDSYVNDYKWIKFLVNSDYGLDNTTYAPFPGEDCYDGGKTKYGTAANSPAYNGTAVVLRDIRQLSNYFADNTPTGNVTVTAFIDEYLYNYDPRNDNNRVTSKDASSTTVTTTYKSIIDESIIADELLLWKRSVNNNARMMHIVKAGDMKYSKDGQTSLSRSVVSIYQKPILSLYNHMATNLKTAWGVETVNETPKMIVSRADYPNSSGDNYYTYAQKLISGNTWASVISSTNRYGFQEEEYNDPSYACALRNRDFNGDGNIDQNEMQWYLAALDQMSGLWIAEPIFTDKLFDPQNPDGEYQKNENEPLSPATHYVTSTIKNSSPMVYWAEEFGSTSTHKDAIGWHQAPKVGYEANNAYNTGTPVVSLRCVRNLGMKYTSTELPQNYYQATEPSSATDGSIDLSYINVAALRTAPDSGVPLAYGDINGSTENNRPFAGFFIQYAGTYVSSWRDAYDMEIKNESVCPDGYRMPNQREMILMTVAIDTWYLPYNNYGVYTMFNGNYNAETGQFASFYYIPPVNNPDTWNPDRVTRLLHSGVDDNKIGNTYNSWNGTNEYVRCVKDNPDAKQDASSEFEDEGDNW